MKQLWIWTSLSLIFCVSIWESKNYFDTPFWSCATVCLLLIYSLSLSLCTWLFFCLPENVSTLPSLVYRYSFFSLYNALQTTKLRWGPTVWIGRIALYGLGSRGREEFAHRGAWDSRTFHSPQLQHNRALWVQIDSGQFCHTIDSHACLPLRSSVSTWVLT